MHATQGKLVISPMFIIVFAIDAEKGLNVPQFKLRGEKKRFGNRVWAQSIALIV